jgi:hypothetical protein
MFKPRFVHFVPAMLACAALGACSASPEDVSAQSEAASSKCAPALPSTALEVPAGNRLAFSFDAIGVQIYTCTATATGAAWVFSAPEATLYNDGGQVAGTHYAGPTWRADDGTTVVGAKVAGVTVDASSIPWLLLRAVSHTGDDGRMTDVSYIQRLDTSGGLAPATGCDADHVGSVARVDYTATYFFYRPSTDDNEPSSCD